MVQFENIKKNLVGVICAITSLISLLPGIYSIYTLSGNDFSRCNSALSLMLMLNTAIPIVMIVITIINTILMCKENYSVYTIFAWVFVFLFLAMVAFSVIIILTSSTFSDVDDADEAVRYTARVSGSKAKLAAYSTLLSCALIFVIVLITSIACMITHIRNRVKGIKSWV